MTSKSLSDEHWDTDNSQENLTRYQEDGLDLSPAINQGQRVADLRGLCELSVDELAEKSGLKRSELMAVEAGLQILQQAQATRLAECMGVNYSDLWVEPSD